MKIWIVLLFLILGGGIFIMAYKRKRHKKISSSKAAYVCDVCGDRDCVCRKKPPVD